MLDKMFFLLGRLVHPAASKDIIPLFIYSLNVVYLYYRLQGKESPLYSAYMQSECLSAIRKSSFASSISWLTTFPLSQQRIRCEGCSSLCYRRVPETYQ
jgi:hypothetical protein